MCKYYQKNEKDSKDTFIYVKDDELYINKKDFLKQFDLRIDKDRKSLRSFVHSVTNIDSNQSCCLPLSDLYGSIKSYFDVLNDDEWLFYHALLVMLCVDACIQTSIIGMVKYKV